MKVSVSLPSNVIVYLDDYAERHEYASRSAVLNEAVRLLRAAELSDAYEDAWNDWEGSQDAATWEVTAADGLDRAPAPGLTR